MRFAPIPSIEPIFVHPSVHPSLFQNSDLQCRSDNLGPLLGREGLGALDRSTDSTVDDQLGQDTDSSRDTEQNGVVAGLSQTVVLEKDTGVRIDVGVWVLGLSVLSQNTWGDLVDLADKLKHRI